MHQSASPSVSCTCLGSGANASWLPPHFEVFNSTFLWIFWPSDEPIPRTIGSKLKLYSTFVIDKGRWVICTCVCRAPHTSLLALTRLGDVFAEKILVVQCYIELYLVQYFSCENNCLKTSLSFEWQRTLHWRFLSTVHTPARSSTVDNHSSTD